MRKTLKILLFVFGSLIIAVLGLFLAFNVMTANAELNPDFMINPKRVIEFYDKHGVLFSTSSKGLEFTKIDDINDYTLNAFISTEDKRFYSHNGIDKKALIRAVFSNVKNFSFSEGASTISQQLIKNTHLSNEKTIKRKLNEIKLALKLEKNYSKKEILEMYLNTIYFGNNCYGITEACDYYFEKSPKELTVNESAILAGIIKSPLKYSPNLNSKNCTERKNLVLKNMLNEGYITNSQYERALSEDVVISHDKGIKEKDFIKYAKSEVENIIDNYPYEYKILKVYTDYDEKIQKSIEENFYNDKTGCDKSVIVLGANNTVCAYFSNAGEIKRQVGSTIKPVLVYAPSLEQKNVFPCSIIKDEQVNYNGYSPKNYGGKYYGDVSIRESLSKSLNSCSVKLLNYTGIDECFSYINKTDINLSEEDKNLSVALGCTYKGITLKEITSAYTPFREQGYYNSPHFITKIENENGNTVYKIQNENKKIFENSTCELMQNILSDCVENGTAKKLKYTNIPLCAKTGTVGNDKGNSDAYNISFNSEYTIGVWYGNANGELLNNAITGGSNPTILSSNIWNSIYKDSIPPDFKINSDTIKLKIDKEEYEKGNIVLADDIAPEKNCINEIFATNNIPKEKSTAYNKPKVINKEISVNTNGITLSLCLSKSVNALIYKYENGKKIFVYDTKKGSLSYTDSNLSPNTEYTYSVIPYYEYNENVYYGEEVFFEKIKSPITMNDFWLEGL